MRSASENLVFSPAAIKGARAPATAIFDSGTKVDATVARLVVPGMALQLGWRFAFLFTSGAALAWIRFAALAYLAALLLIQLSGWVNMVILKEDVGRP